MVSWKGTDMGKWKWALHSEQCKVHLWYEIFSYLLVHKYILYVLWYMYFYWVNLLNGNLFETEEFWIPLGSWR